MIWANMYKRRFVPVIRDFPEGCGVFSGNRSNANESLISSKYKEEIVLRDHEDFRDTKKASSNDLETATFRVESVDDLRDVSTKDKSVLESNRGGKDHREEEVIGERKEKQNETSPIKKRRLSVHNSTMKVETDVVNTSKRVIVSGLAAASKCPWRQPPKNRGSRQKKRGGNSEIKTLSCYRQMVTD